MGLNWAAGARGAARGVEFLQKDQAQSIDAMYKEISDANLRRFRTKETADKQEFLASESSKAQTSREGIAAANLEAQTARDELAATQRADDKSAQADRNKATEEYRAQQQKNQATQAGLTAENRAAAIASTDENRREMSKDRKTEAIRRRQDSVAKRFSAMRNGTAYLMMSDDEKAKLDDKEQVAMARAELENKGALAFDKAYRKLGGTQGSVRYALDYGRMTTQERATVDATVKALTGSTYTDKNGGERKMTAKGAFARAIDGYGIEDFPSTQKENPVNTNTDQPQKLVPENPSGITDSNQSRTASSFFTQDSLKAL